MVLYTNLVEIANETLSVIDKESYTFHKLQWTPENIQDDKEYREVFDLEKKVGYRGMPITLYDSATSAYKAKEKVCILNFASAKHPGGGFLTGARAQEESLCRCSTLYRHLESHSDLYKWSNEHLNKGLYSTWAIYSPKVSIFRDGRDYGFRNEKTASFITCPAVNAGAARRHDISQEKIDAEMKKRIEHIIKVAAVNGEKHLVLGAFGCGVFRNDPERVAEIFLNVLFEYGGYFSYEFAFPTKDANYEAFKKVSERAVNLYDKYREENCNGN